MMSYSPKYLSVLFVLAGALVLFATHTSSADEKATAKEVVAGRSDYFGGYLESPAKRQTAVASDHRDSFDPHSDHAHRARTDEAHSQKNHAHDSAEEVARQVLELQEQMGGSIVRNRAQLRGMPQFQNSQPMQQPSHFNAPPDTTLLADPLDVRDPFPYSRREPRDPSPPSRVVTLREAAWQLDTTAHRLENMDLYEQADALREVAGKMRRDARKMKQLERQANTPWPETNAAPMLRDNFNEPPRTPQ